MTRFHSISITELVRAQFEAYQRATWFIVECMEREHRLTLRALASTWTQSVRDQVDRSVDRKADTGGCRPPPSVGRPGSNGNNQSAGS
jgi:hypothetical protein